MVTILINARRVLRSHAPVMPPPAGDEAPVPHGCCLCRGRFV